MYSQLLLLSFIGLISLYTLFSKTRAAHVFWIVYALLATLSNLVFYNQAIAYKTRFSGDRWSLLFDLYALILAQVFLLLLIGLVWRFSGRAAKGQKPVKPFFLRNRYVAIIAPPVFLLFAILLPYVHGDQTDYTGESDDVEQVTEEKQPAPQIPVKDSVYTNTEARFTLHFPANCTIEGAGSNISIVLDGRNRLDITHTRDNASIEAQIKDRMSILDGSTSLFEKRERTVAGLKGIEMEFMFNDLPWHLHEITLSRDTVLMILQTRSTTEEDYEKNHAMFEKIIESVQFTK